MNKAGQKLNLRENPVNLYTIKDKTHNIKAF